MFNYMLLKGNSKMDSCIGNKLHCIYHIASTLRLLFGCFVCSFVVKSLRHYPSLIKTEHAYHSISALRAAASSNPTTQDLGGKYDHTFLTNYMTYN